MGTVEGDDRDVVDGFVLEEEWNERSGARVRFQGGPLMFLQRYVKGDHSRAMCSWVDEDEGLFFRKVFVIAELEFEMRPVQGLDVSTLLPPIRRPLVPWLDIGRKRIRLH